MFRLIFHPADRDVRNRVAERHEGDGSVEGLVEPYRLAADHGDHRLLVHQVALAPALSEIRQELQVAERVVEPSAHAAVDVEPAVAALHADHHRRHRVRVVLDGIESRHALRVRLFHPVHKLPVGLVQGVEIADEVVRQRVDAEQVLESRVDRDQEVVVRDTQIHGRKITRTDQNTSAASFHMPVSPFFVLNWGL